MTTVSSKIPSRTLALVEPWLGQDCADAVRDQVLTSFVGPGAACRRFAEALVALVGAPYCVPTTSGTVALSLAALALGLRPGDEILVPAYGVISTINAFASIGLVPRLADIDRTTGCIDPAAVERRLTPRTKAVCFVNFAGYTGENVVSVARICAERGIPLIEDAACAIGHRHAGRSAGSFGAVGTLSFSVPKTLTTGQGGALFTSSPQLAEEATKFIDHGDLHWRRTNLNHGIGSNLRFNDVLASLGLAQLRTLDERLDRKRRAYAALADVLGDRLHAVAGEAAPLYYIVFSEQPDLLIEELRSRNILAQRHCRALYEHPVYHALGDTEFPNAAFWSNRTVYLPFGLALSEDDARELAVVVRETAADSLLPAPR